MNAAARTASPPPDQTLGAALSQLARRIGHRGQAAALVLGLSAALLIGWRTSGRWVFVAPAIMLAAFGTWGLASTTLAGWPLPPAGVNDDLRVERLLLRVVAALASLVGLAAGIVAAYALAFAVAGLTVS